jgi:hypothetical protein
VLLIKCPLCKNKFILERGAIAIANRNRIFYTCKENNERGERFEIFFFWILVLLYIASYKKIYAMYCDVEGAESKSVVYVACHIDSQTQSKDVWTGGGTLNQVNRPKHVIFKFTDLSDTTTQV